ncbi:aminoglycoside N(3)-acetyltransferase [Streptomyces muensis]|uniref:AAC(3) family N-acetyltransferase n=1 Tax=Streptomyces muensis TaxID=1077944 RepID=A0A9X1PUZ4_STRM4|nr:AAC(3) family N-acetyltransferase [Streptomyces muensis]MCF1593000.1 AAC(3) family N-acetyltransferase [Streptomyces muensis]
MTPDRPTLAGLGIRAEGVLLVHASLRRTGLPADTVVELLLDALGPKGTLVVPTFTAGNSDTSPAYRSRTRGMTARQRAAYRDALAPFDPLRTPSQGMGRLAEAVRGRADAVRSTHPQTSFAAVGVRAAELMADHDDNCHLGERSPLGRLYAAEAHVLLLGVGYEVCTSFHLAEYRTDDAPTRQYGCAVLREGERHWFTYEDVALYDGDFADLGAAFEAQDVERAAPLIRHGRLGHAVARLLPVRAAVDFATGWLPGRRPSRPATRQSQIAPVSLH